MPGILRFAPNKTGAQLEHFEPHRLGHDWQHTARALGQPCQRLQYQLQLV